MKSPLNSDLVRIPSSGTAGRWLLALSLIAAAFFSLWKSDPGIVFVSDGGAYQSPENIFRMSRIPMDLTVVVLKTNEHSSLRMHLTACPPELPNCVPGQFFRVPIPDSGQIKMSFPNTKKKTVEIEVFRTAFHPYFLLFLALLLSAFLLVYQGEARWLVTAVILSCGTYFSITMGTLRGMDVRGHVAHVENIARDGLWVSASDCWQCYQPPFYYALASSFLGWPYKIWAAEEACLQGLALLLHCLSVPLIVGAIRPFARSRADLLLFAALVCLWPAAILQSVRLGNDGLLNLIAFLCFFLLIRKQWKWAMAAAAAGFLIKNSGIVLLAIAGASVFWNLIRKRIPGRTFLACAAIGLLALCANKGIQLIKNYDPKRLSQLPPRLGVVNTPANVLLPDILSFVTEPFVNPWVNTPNRDHLQNYFWKTSLFGEWGFHQPFGKPLAQLLSLLLVLLLLLVAAIFFQAKFVILPGLALASSFAAITYFRLFHPFADTADFRFVFPPVIMGLTLMLAQARAGFTALLSRSLAFGILFFSQVFFGLLWLFESG